MMQSMKNVRTQKVNSFSVPFPMFQADIDLDLRFQSGLSGVRMSHAISDRFAINRRVSTVFHVLLFITRQVAVSTFFHLFVHLSQEQLSNIFCLANENLLIYLRPRSPIRPQRRDSQNRSVVWYFAWLTTVFSYRNSGAALDAESGNDEINLLLREQKKASRHSAGWVKRHFLSRFSSTDLKSCDQLCMNSWCKMWRVKLKNWKLRSEKMRFCHDNDAVCGDKLMTGYNHMSRNERRLTVMLNLSAKLQLSIKSHSDWLLTSIKLRESHSASLQSTGWIRNSTRLSV